MVESGQASPTTAMWNTFRALKQRAGAILYDWPRFRRALRTGVAAGKHPGWVNYCNRHERLIERPDGPGVRCDWNWTTDLHLCRLFPGLGRELLQHCLQDWPIRFADQPPAGTPPLVSFIITHKGNDRLEQLRWTVRSIYGQLAVPVECILVDQSPDACARGIVVADQYLHHPHPTQPDAWYKTWAFNLGARAARGEILVFHDGDIVCPEQYAAELVKRMGDQDAASIQRFLFYLRPDETRSIFAAPAAERLPQIKLTPERVLQNWEGGTIAVKRDAFFAIGGFDEGFEGWGGEDNEFFDRCRTLRHLRFGDLSFLHLWHAPQSDRHQRGNKNIEVVLPARLAIDPVSRINELTARQFGQVESPQPSISYRAALNSATLKQGR